MLFMNFQKNICVSYFLHRCLKVLGQRVNKFILKDVETTRNDLPVTHDTFRRKFDVKAVSNKVQVPPLLRQRHNAAIGLFSKSSFGA